MSFALRKTNGDWVATAALLGTTKKAVYERVHRDDQLRALWGDKGFGSESPRVTEAETRTRSPEDLPDGVMPPKGIEWVDLVSEQDLELLRKGLKGMGLSDSILTKVKKMSVMAAGGRFLAAALQVTHQSYFAGTMETFELAGRVKKLLDDDEGETDTAKKLSSEDKKDYYGIYLELQAALGQAYSLNLKGAEAIFRMTMAANRRGVRTKAPRPGFGALAVEAPDGQD